MYIYIFIYLINRFQMFCDAEFQATSLFMFVREFGRAILVFFYPQ